MLKNKTYVISGASRGIGFELTKILLIEGHTVYAISRNTSTLNLLKKENNFDNLKIVEADIGKALPNFIENDHPIDCLINNAGLLINKSFETLSLSDFENSYNTNVFGAIRLIKTCLPGLRLAKGNICNISSMGGVDGTSKFAGLSAYSSSKGALTTLSECLAEEFKNDGIHVNVLALGAVQTEMLAEAFPGYEAPVTAIEMANFVKEFVSKSAKLMNGKIVQVALSTP